MVSAWYMKFVEGHHGSLDRVGGLPSHLPANYPTFEGTQLQFVAQFQCDDRRLRVGDSFLVQIYRGDPCLSVADPVVVFVPHGAPENSEAVGVPDPDAKPHDVHWELRHDPDNGDSLEDLESKLWGTCYFGGIVPDGYRLFLSLCEMPADFNFGGDELMLAIDETRGVLWIGA